MRTLLQDLKFGVRIHMKTPGATLLSIVTLGLGIGASAAVFSVVNAILIKPLPYTDFERIAIPWRQTPPHLKVGYNELPWHQVSFKILLRESKTFQDLGAFKGDSFNLTGVGDPALLEGLRVSAGFFPALGVSPVLGRTFEPDEDKPGNEHVVVLGYRLWQERFGGEEIRGRTVDLNGAPYTIVGVMPPEFVFPHGEEMPDNFNFPRETQLWTPLALPEAPPPNAPSDLAIIGRLAPNLTIEQAQQEMDRLVEPQEQQFPQAKGMFNARVTPLSRQVAGDTRFPLILMLGAVGVVLLIACSNVANLLLARSLGRTRELTVRAALGAGSGRLARQLVAESLLLAISGGIVGIFIAQAGIHFVKVLGPSSIPRLQEVTLDFWVSSFAVLITFVTAAFIGLVPIIGVSRLNLADSLKEGNQRLSNSASGQRSRKVLLVLEVAMALVLVVAAGLLFRTFVRLLNTDAGFNAAQVLTFEVSLPQNKYKDAGSIAGLYHRALQSWQSLPGVQSAGIAYAVPMGGATEGSVIRIPGRPPTNEDGKRPFANYTIASPGYFAAVSTPVLRGRDFDEGDSADSIPVVIVNKAMAEQYWPGEDPIDKQVGLGSPRFPLMKIIGVVADVKHLSPRESPGPEMYVPYTQKPYPSMLIMHAVVRTRGEPASIIGSVREALHGIDSDLPIAKVTTLTTLVDDSIAKPRFSMLLLAAFGGTALLLACLGMYSVISFNVVQRTPEIGIRLALGAQRSTVVGMIVGQGALLTGLGIVIGLIASLVLTRLMDSMLYGVQASDPLTFGAVTILLILVALLACYLPAWRASRVDPMTALRYE